jgi:hypothetical protein
MPWTKRAAHLLLRTRVKTLNHELRAVFRRWYLDFPLRRQRSHSGIAPGAVCSPPHTPLDDSAVLPHGGATDHGRGHRAAAIDRAADRGLRSDGPTPTRRGTSCLYSLLVARHSLARLAPWNSACYAVRWRRAVQTSGSYGHSTRMRSHFTRGMDATS